MKRYIACLIPVVVFAIGCAGSSPETGQHATQARVDNHSFARADEVVSTHLDMDLVLDFDRRRITGTVAIDIENQRDSQELWLDTAALKIHSVTLDDGSEAAFTHGDSVTYIGRPLSVKIKPTTKRVTIAYETLPGAPGILWMGAEQTRDKTMPFMFTQSQAILARSWVPCQDNPQIRITYRAKVKVPKGMMALMSAENPTEISPTGEYTFEMPQPIPSYLLALAAGGLSFREIGARSGVYAEPSLVDKAKWEFADTEKMIVTAESLYGPYLWGRFDILVLPPSFPFGGMENPRLTFVTPVLVAGDRSLVSTVAHELAHSWSGNLVTSATWDDFWLNEGFTTYFERRIMEVLYGTEVMDLHAVIGMQDLESDLEELSADDTRLKTDFTGRDPDESASSVPYEKGYLFLRLCEQTVGRDLFDQFLKTYFNKHKFQTMTTDRFVAYLKQNLPEARSVGVDSWVYEPQLPAVLPKIPADRFVKVDNERTAWVDGVADLDGLKTTSWINPEWQHFINKMPELSQSQMKALDQKYDFAHRNGEIQRSWFLCSIKNNYEPAFPQMEAYLLSIGRRWLIHPIYRELAKTPEGLEFARDIYRRARPTYHTITVNTIDKALDWDGSSQQGGQR